jgi:hypothetical protein
VVGSCGRFFFLFSCRQGLTCIFFLILDLKGGFYIEIGEARGNNKKVSNWKVKTRFDIFMMMLITKLGF